MKTNKIIQYALASLIFIIPSGAMAFCPVCTVGVIAGVGLSRWLGIDDSVTSIWIGALIVSLIYFTEKWLDEKKIKFSGRLIIDSIVYYALILVPLMKLDITGHPHNKLFGVDKIILGVIIGSVFFIGGYFLDLLLKKSNKGKAYFPFQRVVVPISILVILSMIFYLMTR
jgi:hypothetical protein